MLNQFEDKIAPVLMAGRGRTLEVSLSIAKMVRLSELLKSNAGVVAASLSFDTDSEGIKYISGTAEAVLSVECQRCMQPVDVAVNCEFLFGLVTDETLAQNLPDEYEPLVISEELISLVELIEDEIILALPVVSMHEDTKCSSYVSEYAAEDSDLGSEDGEERVYPFAQLGDLLKNKQ